EVDVQRIVEPRALAGAVPAIIRVELRGRDLRDECVQLFGEPVEAQRRDVLQTARNFRRGVATRARARLVRPLRVSAVTGGGNPLLVQAGCRLEEVSDRL